MSVQITSQGIAGTNITIQPDGTTSTVFNSGTLDSTFGTNTGSLLARGSAGWQLVPPGTAGQVLQTNGANGAPSWVSLAATVSSAAMDAAFGTGTGILARQGSAWATVTPPVATVMLRSDGTTIGWQTFTNFLDSVFGTTQGSILYRASTIWTTLGPGTAGQVLASGGAAANPSWASAGGSGTVTSVALTMPSIFSVTGSPVTTTGTLGVTLANQNANLVFSGPSSGGAAVPTFRALVSGDLPSISSLLDGISSTQGAVLYRGASSWSALAAGAAGNVLTSNGGAANPSWSAVAAASVPKNYILNGGMQVSQENGTTAGNAAASGYYGADTFPAAGTTVGSGVLSVVQSANPTPGGSPTRLRTVVGTAQAVLGASDSWYISHSIEGYRAADLLLGTAAAKTFTCQFGVKAPAGTYSITFRNNAGNRTYVTTFTISAGEANTEVVKSVTVPGDTSGTWTTDNTTGLRIFWGLAVNTSTGAVNATTGAWTGASGNIFANTQFNLLGTLSNVFELFDVGLYVGSTAPSFQLPDFVDELRRCMRYWEKSYLYATALGTASLTGSDGSFFNGLSSSTSVGFTSKYTVRKRAAPTMTVYSPNSGASGNVYNAQLAADVVPSQLDNINDRSFRVGITTSASAGQSVYLHWKADARL